MPFLAIIPDFDIILGSFWFKIITIRVLGQKWHSKKKKTCQEAYKQSSGVGMHPQMVAFQNLGTGKFKTILLKITQKYMIFIYFCIFPFKEGLFRSSEETYIELWLIFDWNKFWICQFPNFEKGTIWGCIPTPDDCLQASCQGPFFLFEC